MAGEDPGIVFTVKELIGRLDGKLDMMMNVLTNKADRSDVASLDRRVGAVEEKVGQMHKREGERDAAALAEERVERNHQDHRRWIIGTLIATGLLVAAVITIVVMAMSSKGY